MGILAEPALVAWRSASQVDGVGLSHESCDTSRCTVDLIAIIGEARAVYVETAKDLRYRLVEAEDNLDVPNRIMRCNGDGVLGTNSLTQRLTHR